MTGSMQTDIDRNLVVSFANGPSYVLLTFFGDLIDRTFVQRRVKTFVVCVHAEFITQNPTFVHCTTSFGLRNVIPLWA